MDKRLRSSGRDLATTPAPPPAAARSGHRSHRLSVYEWTPSPRAQIGKSPQINTWPVRVSPSASGICLVGRLPGQLLIDRLVFGVRSVPSRRKAARKRLRGVAIAHGRSPGSSVWCHLQA
jgi:hypothetical protein